MTNSHTAYSFFGLLVVRRDRRKQPEFRFSVRARTRRRAEGAAEGTAPAIRTWFRAEIPLFQRHLAGVVLIVGFLVDSGGRRINFCGNRKLGNTWCGFPGEETYWRSGAVQGGWVSGTLPTAPCEEAADSG